MWWEDYSSTEDLVEKERTNENILNTKTNLLDWHIVKEFDFVSSTSG